MPSKAAKSADDSPENAPGAEPAADDSANVPAFEPLDSDDDAVGEPSAADAPLGGVAPLPASPDAPVVIATKRCYGRCDELGLHIASGYIDIEILSDGSARII